MALRLFVDRPCALKILGFTLGTILEMRESTRGFSVGFATWNEYIHTYICYLNDINKLNLNIVI
jgi:hypothetical protein